MREIIEMPMHALEKCLDSHVFIGIHWQVLEFIELPMRGLEKCLESIIKPPMLASEMKNAPLRQKLSEKSRNMLKISLD